MPPEDPVRALANQKTPKAQPLGGLGRFDCLPDGGRGRAKTKPSGAGRGFAASPDSVADVLVDVGRGSKRTRRLMSVHAQLLAALVATTPRSISARRAGILAAIRRRRNRGEWLSMTTAAPGTRIRYMGNKVSLARDVAAIAESVDPNRVLVDLFGGMCSVAGAVSYSGRNVWNNDIQHYAHLVARCLLTSRQLPPSREKAVRTLIPKYRSNLTALRTRFMMELKAEREVLNRGSTSLYREAQESWRHAGNDEDISHEVARLRRRQTGPHRLATLTFAWGYFGLRQSIEIDSVRAAIDAASANQTLSTDEAAWCRLALLQTCSRVASAPGHFAQFLRGERASSLRRILAARRRSVWDSVLDDLDHLSPFGSRRWRAANRVLIADALTIWPQLDEAGLGPAVFYVDPPYSKEQYSRFYHVLETLELYDYPESFGVGRYRPDRFATPLATKSGVLSATRTLLSSIAERSGILLLSYPSTGLLTADLGIDVDALLGEYFDNVRLAIDVPSRHSTLGGRHGSSRHEVVEYVWAAS